MVVFGASGHGKVVVDILISIGINVEAVIDDKPTTDEIFGIRVSKNSNLYENASAIIAIGDNKTRKNIALKNSFFYINAIHPKAVVSKFSTLAEGTVVMAGAVINPNAKIGKHCIINTGVVVEHDCVIEDYVHVSPNASLAGNVKVSEGAHIGIGASIIQGIKIGKWAMVGAGAVIIRDVPDYATVVGNPGRIIKLNKDKINE